MDQDQHHQRTAKNAVYFAALHDAETGENSACQKRLHQQKRHRNDPREPGNNIDRPAPGKQWAQGCGNNWNNHADENGCPDQDGSRLRWALR